MLYLNFPISDCGHVAGGKYDSMAEFSNLTQLLKTRADIQVCRVKTVVIARIAYNLAGLCTNILMPRMLNPTAWNWKGKTCFFWAGTTLIMLAWAYFRLPEPKGLTYLEMDILFQKRAKARKFREFQVNLASTGYFSLQEQQRETWRGYG
jgi:MFS transporter, SP family, general alpha glucoside:H+ symporter